MKVMCIKNGDWKDPDGLIFTGPTFGERVTAIDCSMFPNNYIILEYPGEPDGRKYSYRKHYFIPLSTIDETELLKEREKELQTI